MLRSDLNDISDFPDYFWFQIFQQQNPKKKHLFKVIEKVQRLDYFYVKT